MKKLRVYPLQDIYLSFLNFFNFEKNQMREKLVEMARKGLAIQNVTISTAIMKANLIHVSHSVQC